jgi:hydrogenase small subunit
VKVTGGYYDADMINALYSTLAPFPQDSVLQGDPNDLGLPLNIVNDAGDLLVGDGVGALVPAITPRYLTWADGAAGVGLLPNPNPFPGGYITLEWNATVMAAAGDIPVAHLNSIVNGGGYAGLFVLVVDGSVPTGGVLNSKEKMCLVFDNYEANPLTGANAPGLGPVTAADALRWMAPKAAAVISVGTCASYGGIPAGAGNKTGARSVQQFFTEEGISTPVINVPGCPPHPDWIVYPVAYVIANSLALPALDNKGRPLAVYSGSRGNASDTFCFDCPNLSTLGTPQAAQELGDAGCLAAKGCKGPYTVGDCPIRQKNTADDGTLMNWCVGAQGAASLPSTHVGSGIGEGRHPCQGCIEPDFPDWAGLATSGDRTRKNVKGFYNE